MEQKEQRNYYGRFHRIPYRAEILAATGRETIPSKLLVTLAPQYYATFYLTRSKLKSIESAMPMFIES
jgi:hypothetical protein